MSEHKAIKSKSGNIISAAHDGAGKVQVRFKTGLYESRVPVPPEAYKNFEATFDVEDSSGSHFHKHMKQFNFVKIA